MEMIEKKKNKDKNEHKIKSKNSQSFLLLFIFPGRMSGLRIWMGQWWLPFALLSSDLIIYRNLLTNNHLI